MRNPNAIWALLVAVVAVAVLASAVVASEVVHRVELVYAVPAVPVSALLALASLSLSGRARALHQRTLGRAGGRRLTAAARAAGLLALLLSLTAALALGVFAVLVLTD